MLRTELMHYSHADSPRTAAFERSALAGAERELLRDGRFAHARVDRVRNDGVDWIFKDFFTRCFFVRHSVGRFLLGREVRVLRRLEGICGVRAQAFRVDRFAIAARYVTGRTLANVDVQRMTTPYLRALEVLLDQLHRRGVVHLDTRGGGNLLMMPERTPGIIDFRAALSTHWMLAALRRSFNAMDISGAYKKWLQWQPHTISAQRRADYERLSRWRRWWVLSGYFGMRRQQRPQRAARRQESAA